MARSVFLLNMCSLVFGGVSHGGAWVGGGGGGGGRILRLEMRDGIYTCRFYLLCLQCCGILYNTTLLSGYGTSTRHKEPEHLCLNLAWAFGYVWIICYTRFFDPCV